MRFFHKYQNHTTFENRPIILRKPDVSLCSIEGNKRNGIHYNYLPYDAEIEYLESDGNAYIDTGLFGNQNTDYEVKTMFTKNTSYPYVFGAQQADRQRRFSLMEGSYNTFYYAANDDTLENNLSLSSTEQTGINVVKKVGRKIYVNNTLKVTLNNTNYTTPVTITLYAGNQTGGVRSSNRFTNGKIYYIKFYESNVLVRDFIPVRVGTTGYMYDKVSKRLFGNSGTGNFTLGQDIIPIEYIRSTGTQYINTGVKPNTNTKVRLKFKNLVITGNVIIGYMGSGDSNDWRFFNATSKAYFDVINSRINTSGAAINANVNYEIELGNYYIKNLITGTNIISGSSKIYTGDRAITLNGDKSFSQNIFYYVKIFDGNTLIRDFVPVRIGTVGYLFDKVNRQLYGNAGSGAFTLGPDIT